MAPRRIKIGIHVPAASADQLPSGNDYIEFFKQAEAMGFHSLWTEDRIFHNANFLDSLTLLSWAAASTERIQLGTAVLLLALRNAPLLARQLSAMDHLSRGRMNLGVSLGGRPNEYQGLGINMSERVAHLRESIIVLQRLLAGDQVTYAGRFYQLDEATIRPAVIRSGGVPLHMGGHVDAVLRRVAELADGWINGPFSSPDDFRESWAKIHEYAREFGRDPAELEAGKLVYVAVNENKGHARRLLEPFIRDYYGPSFDLDRNGIFGPAEEVADGLRAFADAGVTMFMLGVPTLDIGHLERIAKDVMPRLTLS